MRILLAEDEKQLNHVLTVAMTMMLIAHLMVKKPLKWPSKRHMM